MTSVVTFKRSFDGAVDRFTQVVGWAGMAMLAGCGVLALIPSQHWPPVLHRGHLQLYIAICLIPASLLGWRLVNAGEERLKDRFGQRISLFFFVILPLVCFASRLFVEPLQSATGLPAGHGLWTFLRFYPAGVVALALATFLVHRVRLTVWKAAWSLVLLAPFALLFLNLELGLQLGWIDAHVHRTMSLLGEGAIVVQLVMAYFVGN